MDRYGLLSKKDDNILIPLISVYIKASVLDFIAEVELEQTFSNSENRPIEAIYKFPLDGNCAVCYFEAKIDHKVIVAKVYESGKAAEIYDDAISGGHGAYLLEQSENILQVSVGNLPPNKSVTIKIIFVQELLTENLETLLFYVPTALYSACRTAPRVHVDVKMALPIVKLTSLPLTPSIAEYSSNHAELFIEPNQKPDKIQVSIFLGPAMKRPRLWVEKWNGRKGGNEKEKNENILLNIRDPLSYMLAFSPDIDYKEQEQDVLFVLDRSGSMEGPPTEQLMHAMYHALKCFPSSFRFNIILFGSSHEFLFPSPVFANFDSLNSARNKISTFRSNFLGGTNLLGVLKAIYDESGNKCIFILTDGEVDRKSSCISLVHKHNKTCRVSTIGIGKVDKTLVTTLASAGNGKCELLLQSTQIVELEDKLDSVMKSMLAPAYEDVSITWYDTHGNKNENIKQAPERLPPIFAGTLYRVYGLVPDTSVNLSRANIVASGKAGNLNMSLDLERSAETLIEGSTIHILAAKQLIREIEEGALRWKLSEEQEKEEIVRLGLEYNLASSFTSFVAVEEREEPTNESMTQIDINETSDVYIDMTKTEGQALLREQSPPRPKVTRYSGLSWETRNSQSKSSRRMAPNYIICLAILCFPFTLLLILFFIIHDRIQRATTPK